MSYVSNEECALISLCEVKALYAEALVALRALIDDLDNVGRLCGDDALKNANRVLASEGARRWTSGERV